MNTINFYNDGFWHEDITESEIIKNIEVILNFCAIKSDIELSITLCNDKEIQMLNKTTRGKDKPTDVLSYPHITDEFLPAQQNSLGEIFISFQTMEKQANEIGHSIKEEYYRLLVHGILHLIGYDHEINSTEELRMKQKEDECLSIIFT